MTFIPPTIVDELQLNSSELDKLKEVVQIFNKSRLIGYVSLTLNLATYILAVVLSYSVLSTNPWNVQTLAWGLIAFTVAAALVSTYLQTLRMKLVLTNSQAAEILAQRSSERATEMLSVLEQTRKGQIEGLARMLREAKSGKAQLIN